MGCTTLATFPINARELVSVFWTASFFLTNGRVIASTRIETTVNTANCTVKLIPMMAGTIAASAPTANQIETSWTVFASTIASMIAAASHRNAGIASSIPIQSPLL